MIENYVGLTADEVTKKLIAANVNYTIEYQDTDAYEPGIVIGQSIREGVTVSTTNKLSNLVLTVSAADESIVLQDYADMNYKNAYTSLKNLGLEPVLRTEPSDKVEPGLVIRTEPEANTQVLRGETVIIIYATEPKSSIVPDVVGNTVAEAVKKLEEANLNYTIEGSSEVLALDQKKQYVILTNPVAGSSVARKSSVKLFVGTKEDYQNGGTPTPTPPQAVVDIIIKGSGTATGAGTYELNTQVTLTATPATGFKFEYWVDSLGNIVSYSLNFTFVVKESAAYTVVFSALPTNTPAPTDTPTPPPATPTPTPAQNPDPNPGGGGNQNPPDPNQGGGNQNPGQGGNNG